MMPFAHNEATRFISPTKTLEYLAAGKPVVSTSIRDVVHPYGELGLVRIADTPQAFAVAVEDARIDDALLRSGAISDFLGRTSWDQTWSDMSRLLDEVVLSRTAQKRHEVEIA